MSDNDLTVAEAAELSGYSEGHIRWLVRQDRIEAALWRGGRDV